MNVEENIPLKAALSAEEAQYQEPLSPVRRAWTEDVCVSDRSPTSGVGLGASERMALGCEEKGNSSEEDSFDYDKDSLNIQVRLRCRDTISRGTSGMSGAHREIVLCDSVDSESSFMGHGL